MNNEIFENIFDAAFNCEHGVINGSFIGCDIKYGDCYGKCEHFKPFETDENI